MRHHIGALVLGITLGSTGLAAARDLTVTDQATQLISQAQQELYRLDRMSDEVRDPQLRQRMQQVGTRLSDRLVALQHLTDRVDARPEVVVRPRPGPARPGHGPPVASGHELSSIVSAVRSETWGDEKLSVLRAATAGRRFSVDQVGTLLDQFTWGDDKLEAARLLRNKVVDPHNWYLLAGRFTWSDDKQAVLAMTRG